ncbi:Uncharacterised protein [Vibrio cholerae]|nr:Uncharacterised protein [Vibrio cholerae]
MEQVFGIEVKRTHAAEIFKSQVNIKAFFEQYLDKDYDALERLYKRVGTVLESYEEERKQLEEAAKAEKAAREAEAQALFEIYSKNDSTYTIEQARTVIEIAHGGSAEIQVETKTSKPRKEAKKWKLNIGGEVVEKALQGRKPQEILDELQAQGYTDTWQLIAKEDQEAFIKYAEEAISYKGKIEEIKAHFAKGSKKK